MVWWQALVLGLTQGLTEFLPVSSSGHLTLLHSVLKIDVGGAQLLFDIILHIGTLVAVCFIFYREIAVLFKKPYRTLLYITVATIPAALCGLLFGDFIEDKLLHGKSVGFVLAAFFLVTAALLFYAELYSKRRKKTCKLNLKTSLCMGCAQAVAVLPGISRSGSTVCAGIFAGGDGEEVSRFSFLMSVPVILGSFFVELLKGILKSGEGSLSYAVGVSGGSIGLCVAIGFISSAVCGLFAIKVMLKAIKSANYKWFSLYLTALAAACLILQCAGCFN